MTVPVWPKGFGSNELSSQFLYYLSFILAVVTFITLKWAYSTRFGLVLNAFKTNPNLVLYAHFKVIKVTTAKIKLK